MLPHKPEDWPLLFERHLKAGDLEAVVALYELGAVFVSPSGEMVASRGGIRHVLAGLIDAQARLHGCVVKVVLSADIALDNDACISTTVRRVLFLPQPRPQTALTFTNRAMQLCSLCNLRTKGGYSDSAIWLAKKDRYY
jgi:hypothetical protein